MRIEKLHLDRAIMASSAPEPHVLVHCKGCLLGSQIPELIRTNQPVISTSRPVPMSVARSRPTRTDGEPGSRNNHYGCPTIRKARPGDPVVKAMAAAAEGGGGGGASAGGRSAAAAADDPCATNEHPAKPGLQQGIRTTVHREVQPRDAWTSPP